MAFAPELSIRSGGLPPTNRGWSSWAISVDGGAILAVELVRLFEDLAGELDVVDAVATLEDHGVEGCLFRHAERVSVGNSAGGAGGSAAATCGTGSNGSTHGHEHGCCECSAQESTASDGLVLNVHF